MSGKANGNDVPSLPHPPRIGTYWRARARRQVHNRLELSHPADSIRRRTSPVGTPSATRALPGEPPYTRGIHPAMYRSRLWTMRQFAGFGTAEDTNARFRYLLSQGQTGLSVAFDLPTLMGYDSDHPLSEGEVGKCGVAISSLADMEALFDQIPLATSPLR